MTPKKELEYLKGYIKLSEREAVKRDLLEGFLENRDKVLLLDADSLLFSVCHYHLDKEQDFNLMYDDYHTQLRSIVNAIEDEEFNIEQIVHFFSTCSNNFRYEIYPEYKANRERTPLTELVYLFKGWVIDELRNDGEYVSTSDEYEADDLIAQAVEVMEEHYPIVASIDKDLKQIPCCHFDYYKVKVGVDEFGDDIRDFKGFSYTTPQEGRELLLKQLLEGDTSDNIKGVSGIGKVKAEKALKGKSEFIQLLTVARLYNDMKRLRTNIKLMKL
jgi:DNA polymerase-1